MKILGTIATINANDCQHPVDIDVIRNVVGIDPTNSVCILPGEEDGFFHFERQAVQSEFMPA